MTSNELLATLHRDVLTIIDAAKEFELLPDSALNWKERPEKWSILECLEHLNRYSSFYHAELRKAIARTAPRRDKYTARSTWMGKKFIAMMHPDNATKHKTFKRMDPIHGQLKRDVLNSFLKNQDELINIINDATTVDLNKASIPVEFLKILRMNLGDALQFIIVHEQRHIRQAQAIRPRTETFLTPALKV